MKRNVTEITTSGPNHGQTFQNVSSKGLLLTSIPNIVNRNRDRDRDRDGDGDRDQAEMSDAPAGPISS